MKNIFRKYFVATFFIAGLSAGTAVLAPAAKAEPPQAPSSEQIDSTLDTFKNMPPEERQQIMNTAMESFKNMSPEDRQKLIEQAKAQASTLSDAQKSAYENRCRLYKAPSRASLDTGVRRYGIAYVR